MLTTIQSEQTREAILDATDRLLASYGYKKMTIDDIAREVGISKGSVYLHFSSKEEIALSQIDRIVGRVTKELETIAASRVKPSEKLRRMLAARVLVRFDQMRHYTRNINELLGDLRVKLIERREKYSADEAAIFARVIKKGQADEIFQAGDTQELAHSFMLATNSLLPLSLTTRELGKRKEIKDKVLCLANLMLKGLEK